MFTARGSPIFASLHSRALLQLRDFSWIKIDCIVSIGEFVTRFYWGLSFLPHGRILKIDPAEFVIRSIPMSRCILLRYAVPALLAAALLPAAAFAQSQDSESVAEAARRTREKKKAQAKPPAKVITDDTLDVKKGDVQSATAEQLRIPGTPEASAQAASSTANAPAAAAAANSSAMQAPKDGKEPKEVTDLREKLKQAESDLDLLNREYRLDQDAYFSKPDYANDTAGKQKLDDEKVQISDKQQEVDRLKAKLADLLQLLGLPSSAPPKF